MFVIGLSIAEETIAEETVDGDVGSHADGSRTDTEAVQRYD